MAFFEKRSPADSPSTRSSIIHVFSWVFPISQVYRILVQKGEQTGVGFVVVVKGKQVFSGKPPSTEAEWDAIVQAVQHAWTTRSCAAVQLRPKPRLSCAWLFRTSVIRMPVLCSPFPLLHLNHFFFPGSKNYWNVDIFHADSSCLKWEKNALHLNHAQVRGDGEIIFTYLWAYSIIQISQCLVNRLF